MSNLVKREELAAAHQTDPTHRGEWSIDVNEGGFELRRHYQTIRKHKWLILAVVLTVITAVALETSSTTPLYRATARVQIDPDVPKVLPYQGITESSIPYYDDYYLQTKYEALKSRTLARRVIKRLNLAEDAVFLESPSRGFFSERVPSLAGIVTNVFSLLRSQPEASSRPLENEPKEDAALVGRLLGNLSVQIMKNSWLIQVSYSSHEPEFAATVANTVTDEFIEENFERKYDATMMATQFLEEQLEDLKIKVEKSEEALVGYAREHHILNLSERQTIVLKNLSDLNSEMTRAQAQLMAETARYDAIKGATVEDFPPSLTTPVLNSLATTLLAKEQSLATLSTQFGPDWPQVVQTKKEIAQITAQLSKEREQAIELERNKFQVALDHNRRLLNALEKQKRLANQLREKSIQYNILQREVDTNTELYDGLLQRLKQAGVSAGLKSSNIQVVDKAEVPRGPYRPRAQIDLAMGLVVALVSGVGLAFLLESLDNTVKTSKDVEQHLGLPSLGLIPAMGRFLERGDRKALADRQGKRNAAILLYKYLESRSQIWEAYRSLRTSILFSHSDTRPQKILVSSALAGEGKTTTAVNTAIVMAQTGARTMIMDLDMRRPSLARILGISTKGGMSNFLSGNGDLASQIHKTAFPNLYLLPAGVTPPNPAELIGSARMKNALGLLEQYFDYIVIDTPPILTVTDALVVCPEVDGVILVIHGGKTSREAIEKATANLFAVGGTLLGAVINNVDVRSPEYSYDGYSYQDTYYQGKDQSSSIVSQSRDDA